MKQNHDRSCETLLTDLSCAIPVEGWVADTSYGPIPSRPAGGWRVLDYTCKEYSGRMLTTCQADAVVLRIPLNLTGWHAVCLGIALPRHAGEGVLEARLTGQPHWQRLRVRGFGGFALYGPDCLLPDYWKQRRVLLDREEPWTMADLTGRDLEIRPPGNLPQSNKDGWVANLMSVRAIPMAARDVRRIAEGRERPLIFMNDGGGIFFGAADGPGSENIHNALQPFADSDWITGCFGVDTAIRPAEGMLHDQGWDVLRPGDRFAVRFRELIDQGWDPLREVVELAHQQGQKLWGYMRPHGNQQRSWPHDHAVRGRFYGEHLDFRCVEADGQPLAVMSIAHKAVRDQLNRVAAASVERGVDGICLACNRGVPLVRYEQPVLDRFRERFDGDARLVPDTDPQLRLIWQDFVAQWFRELRDILDKASPDHGPRRTLAVIGGATLEWNLGFGIDVGDLARRRLIDVVIPYPELRLIPGAGAPKTYNAYQPIDIDAYVRELKGTETVIMADLGYHGDHALGLAEYYRRAHRFYQAGAYGLSRWDTDPHLAHAGLNSPVRAALWSEVYHPVDRPLTPTVIGGIPLGPPFAAEVSE